jgi:hypothetical protein
VGGVRVTAWSASSSRRQRTRWVSRSSATSLGIRTPPPREKKTAEVLVVPVVVPARACVLGACLGVNA